MNRISSEYYQQRSPSLKQYVLYILRKINRIINHKIAIPIVGIIFILYMYIDISNNINIPINSHKQYNNNNKLLISDFEYFSLDLNNKQINSQQIKTKLNKQINSQQIKTNLFQSQKQQNQQQFKQISDNKNKGKKWQIQKKVWLYKNSKQQLYPQHKSFGIVNSLNTKNIIESDSYTLYNVDQNNYVNYLSQIAQHKIYIVNDILQKRLSSQSNQNIKKQIQDNKQHINKRLIIYYLLLENGGVFVDNNVTVVQKFSQWLQNIMSLPYINVGDKIQSSIQPKCFGFFQRDYGSNKIKLNVKRQYQFEKKMIVFPSLQDWFLACNKKSIYLQSLIDTYVSIIMQGQQSLRLQRLNKNEEIIGKTNPNLIYEQGHLLAQHIILQQKQHQINNKSILSDQSQSQKLAIDQFGLVTINSYLFPRRLQHDYPTWNSKKCFIWMCKLTLQEFQNSAGKFRFVIQIEKWITQMIGMQLNQPKRKSQYIIQNSFMHTYFIKHLPINTQLSQANQSLIQGSQIKKHQLEPYVINQTQNLHNPQWDSFPKHLWTVWDSGLRRNSTFIVQMCSQNLKRSAKNSGFQMHIVTQQNVHQYLSDQTYKRIEYAMSHATLSLTRQALSDLWRLALLMQHGGIYVDSTTFTMNQNFDYIKNITRAPNNLIWNRYGKQPNVLMFWNLQYSNDMVLTIDRKYNTKKVWQLSYESNFIVAVKGSQLIKQWFDVFLDWIVTQYWIVQEQMRDVNIHYQRWTRWDYKYLLVMDAIKYVVGRKQKLIDQGKIVGYQSVSDYYKVWSYPGQMAAQIKFRSQSGFQDTDYRYKPQYQNPTPRFQFPLSYVQSVDGLLVYQGKFFSQGLGINKMLLNFYEQNKINFTIDKLTQIVHPQSLVGKLLLYKYPQKTMYYLSYYTQNKVCLNLQFKGFKLHSF